MTDGPTDGRTDGPTEKWLIESCSTRLKIHNIFPECDHKIIYSMYVSVVSYAGLDDDVRKGGSAEKVLFMLW